MGAEGMARVEILGVPVDNVTAAEALQLAQTLGRNRNRANTAHLVTANAEIVTQAQSDPDLMRILTEADVVVPDGIGLVWAARVMGQPLSERVPGVELAEALIAGSATGDYAVYLLGAAPGVAEEAVARLGTRYPGIRIAGMRHGYFSPQEEAEVLADIRAAQPDVLLVGLGAPRQEKWIAKHRHALGAGLAIGVGGSFDIFAGRSRRAPKWLQKLGLEWLYRLMRQPSRAGRMLALPRFALAVLAAKWRH